MGGIVINIRRLPDWATCFLWLWFLEGGVGAVSAVEVASELVAGGLDLPLFVTHAPNDTGRLFIVEQRGRIKILQGGSVLDPPFLDITSRVSCCSEQGLLGMAFHPQYPSQPYFYVNYTDSSGDTIVARYEVPSATPNRASVSSEQVLLEIAQQASRHNGGWLGFGPLDGYLYISTGDGAAGGCDSEGDAQNLNSLLGKILRIDVNGGFPYGIPASNPFVGVDGADEVWSYGLRNPWRCGFDRITGDLYIADVGQHSWEEVNFQPGLSSGGENYGWNCMEGNHCSAVSGCNPGDCTCNDSSLVDPVYEYNHSTGFVVIGGTVYRGCAIPELQGAYFVADGVGKIWSFRMVGGSAVDLVERTDELDPGSGLSISSISSFGTDAEGELYVCDLAGEVFKIIPTGQSQCDLTVPEPVVFSRGGRYFEVALGVASGTFAVRVDGHPNDPDVSCVSGYVQADQTISGEPFFQDESAWGTSVFVHGAEVRPGASFLVRFDYGAPGEPLLGSSVPVTTDAWGDVNDNGSSNFEDVQLVVLEFQGASNGITMYHADLEPCVPNGEVNFGDIFQTVLAFQGQPFPTKACPVVCP